MSDIADDSDGLIGVLTQAGIEKCRRGVHPVADGRCHFCDEEVAPHQLFCNLDCRDDFERQNKVLIQAGKL